MASKGTKIKVHLGCGAVYLDGYDNLDVPIGKFYFANERPDLAEENRTTLSHYYKDTYYNNFYERYLLKKQGKKLPKPTGKPKKVKKRRKVVVDKTAYADHLPYARGTVDEIRCVQVFEHLEPEESTRVLLHWRELLKSGGKLVIDVPDIIETADLLSIAETDEERAWAEKLIHGNRNDGFAYHKVGYWPEKLKKLLEFAGFKKVKKLTNIHNYPAFAMEAIKVDKSIIVTTINKPSDSLKKYTELEDWNLISVGDKKTPTKWTLKDSAYLSPEDQLNLFPQLGEVAPWNKYSRKNFGYLFAIRNGSEILAEIDDDIAPYDTYPHELVKEKDAKVISGSKFVNIFSYFGDDKSWPRGFPIDEPKSNKSLKVKNKKIYAPIQNSLLDIDGDFDAIYRLTSNKKVEYKKEGEFALDNNVYCPFHSGNTFWFKEAYPLLYMPSFVNPHVEDIWRGYIAQRILWEMGGNLLFVYPTVYTDNRNAHDYLKDFEFELPMFTGTKKLTSILDSLSLPQNPSEALVKVYEKLVKEDIVQTEELPLVYAWIKEIESLL